MEDTLIRLSAVRNLPLLHKFSVLEGERVGYMGKRKFKCVQAPFSSAYESNTQLLVLLETNPVLDFYIHLALYL